MNFTRWSARLPGTQRRAAARDDRSSVPAARAEYARPEGTPAQPDDAAPAPSATDTAEGLPGPALDDLSAREILGRLPAPVALLHGPDHRVAYVNDAYEAAFGPRPTGVPAAEAMPELDRLSVLPLLDQVLRSGTPRTVKSRRTTEGGSYTVTCTPIAGEDGVLVYAADVTDHAEAAERLRTSERRHRETAVTLQRSLLPQELEQPDDLRIAATYQPGGTDAAVGGDWYDVITLGAGRTALVIGDVMGRGVRAAAVMGQLRTAVRAYARLDLPPHEVIQLLDVLAAEIDASQIATCVYAVHDPNEGQLVYASAGHLPILVRDEDGTVQRAADPTGPPLGTGGWVHTSGTIALPPGSTAVLYTDGLVERRSEDIDEGVASLARALAGAKGSPQVVCDRLIRSLGVTAEHDDDVAVLVVQHPARTGANAELFHNAALDLLGGIEAAPRARAFATGVLTSWRFPVELRDLGVLATSELVANSLQHGTPPMRLGLRRTDRRLIIEVTDGDDHLPRRRQAEPADEAGRGISIIASIATSWGSRRTPGGGKAVWCEFALPQ
ncbi:SpoIIE family protein phosphatase [Streptomyces filamentosus]|uniref:SpoIIE family protein phosphatase n=3 Tax=Streptomyces TaxID=1883 RepID=A0ABY4UWE1_STRFL|nr:SpoIIE family protein phosphatase [Streptomyces filamentosus]EFE75760.1 magnesium or manganese-dependent protein phosphatase [Streptomyces filamentosus NRRL 15998]EWS92782.1 magnesium or manganese-dependent protein phosphatase [Streptomyces filamentosus NRRL 11379]MYR79808.1 SpoIIE family protein phosphatase [Streptomyces sp. SID5466]USC48643.1 SpoIIE family protein phosphatase [Streptomyces filamentosus]